MTLQDLENHRKKLIISSQMIVRWFFGLTFATIVINIWLARTDQIGWGQVIFVISTVLFGYILSNFMNKKDIFNENYKKLVIPDIIKKISPQFLYSPEKSIDISIILESKLVLPDYTDFGGEDRIIFKTYGNLQICEAVMAKHVNKDDYQVYLKGLFGYATFPFSFDGITVLRPKNYPIKTFNGEKVRLESPRFMEIWDIETDNQLGARMALGTDIMNNLLYLNDIVKIPISISFIADKVYFATLEDGSFLEPSFYNSVYDNENIQKFSKELSIIHDIVQTFKLRQSK